jgi:hypothetical protein
MQVGISAVVSSSEDAAFVVEAERLGATSVWVPGSGPGRLDAARLPGPR